MTLKKSLENRIRGWFPHESTLISARLMVNHEYKQPPPKIQIDYRESATSAVKTTVFSGIILYGLVISLLFFTLQSYNGLILASWIIIGSAVGIISGKAYTQNQLLRISREYQIKLNSKDFILSIVPLFAILLPGFFVDLFLLKELLQSAEFGLILGVFAFSISLQITRCALFRAYEKRENMRLMQSYNGWGIAIIPKPPNSNYSGSG
jgi:Na+-driven multidrug efflux pump